MILKMGSPGLLGKRQHARICLAYHLLAEIHAHQIFLVDIMVKHVLCSLAQIENPLTQRGRFDAIRHILRVDGTGRMINAADATDTAGNEMGIAGIFALHK